MLIGGRSVDAISGTTFKSVNPYTGQPWASSDGGPEDIDLAVDAARAAFNGEWGRKSGFERAAIMRDIAAAITANAERLALLEVRDSGKLIREMLGQMGAFGTWYTYFSGLADKLEGRTVPPPRRLLRLHDPRAGRRGRRDHPVEHPAAAAHVEAGPGAGGRLHVRGQAVRAFTGLDPGVRRAPHRGRLPAGVFNVVTGCGRETGRGAGLAQGGGQGRLHRVDRHRRAVAQAAADNLNKITLELGGKSPQVVFADADLDAAANGLVAGVFAATGQTCMAGSRLIVHERSTTS